MNEELRSHAGDLPPIRNRCGTIARRIIIVAQAGPVPEYLSSLV